MDRPNRTALPSRTGKARGARDLHWRDRASNSRRQPPPGAAPGPGARREAFAGETTTAVTAAPPTEHAPKRWTSDTTATTGSATSERLELHAHPSPVSQTAAAGMRGARCAAARRTRIYSAGRRETTTAAPSLRPPGARARRPGATRTADRRPMRGIALPPANARHCALWPAGRRRPLELARLARLPAVASCSARAR